MSRPRRDPRAEKAARAVAGGGRPRFALATAKRPRRDPRAEREATAAPGAAGRRRFDLTGAAVAAAPSQAPAPTRRVVENPAFLIFAVPDAPGGRASAHDRQVIGAAHALAGSEGAVVVVGAAEAGADRALALAPHPDPEAQAERLAALIAHFQPRHVLIPESAAGGDLARRVAVRLGEPLFGGAERLSAQEARRPARGRRIERRQRPPRLVTLAEGAALPYAGPPCEARALAPPPLPDPASRLRFEDAPADPAAVPLAEADFVVAAGNGVEDFDAFRALVRALGATPGASRVVCDAGLMPRAAQVGASGTVLAARCYVALGIAGAPQHLQGVAGCEHVVAVNTDLHAAMIARAGLAVVADARAVIAALREALK